MVLESVSTPYPLKLSVRDRSVLKEINIIGNKILPLTGTLDILPLVQILVELGSPHDGLAFLELGKLDLRIEGLKLVTVLLTHFIEISLN